MLTLSQALEDQNDLQQLCKARPFKGVEIYMPNENYGFADAIKTYAGYPLDKPILASIPHGVYMRDRVVSLGELNAKVPAVLNFPSYTAALWKKVAKNKKIIPFACPIHYVIKQFKSEVKDEDRRGTFFMPHHSTAAVDVIFDKDAVVRELEALPDAFKPVTVCIHWHDIQLGLDRFFRDLGYEVVSAGHLSDPDYLYRWLHLLSRHCLAAHCGMGSALFYAVSAGTPFWMTEADSESKMNSKFEGTNLFHKTGPHHSRAALIRMAKIKELFAVPANVISAEQLDIVAFCTQKFLVKSPEALYKELVSLERL